MMTTEARTDKMMWDLYDRVNASFTAGDIDVALIGAIELTQLFPNAPIGYSALTHYLVWAGKVEEAEAVAITGLQKAGQDRWIMHWLAETAHKKGDWKVAEARWQRIAELFPHHRVAHARYLECLLAQDKIPEIQQFAGAELNSLCSTEAPELRIKIADTLVSAGHIVPATVIWASISSVPDSLSAVYLNVAWSLFATTLGRPTGELSRPAQIRFLEALALERGRTEADWIPKLYRELPSVFYLDKAKFEIVINILSELKVDKSNLSLENKILFGLCEVFFSKVNLSDEILDDLLQLISRNFSLAIKIFSLFRAQLNTEAFERIKSRLGKKQNVENGMLLDFLVISTSFDRDLRNSPILFPHGASSLVIGHGRPQPDFASISSASAALAYIRAKAGRQPAPVLSTAPQKLRVALCISGQLRGYREAYETWHNLRLENHDVVRFVHVWKTIGRKGPMPGQLERCFSGETLAAFRAGVVALGWPYIQRRFATLFGWYEEEQDADPEDLKGFYDTPYVVSEEDEPFSRMVSYEKMYYKIEQAHQMAISAPFDFDVIIRFRPDREVLPTSKPNWPAIFSRSRNERIAFVDFAASLHGTVGYVVGDQFAAGCPEVMDGYASTLKKTQISAERNIAGFPRSYRPHANLAYSLLYDGITTAENAGINLGRYFDPPRMDAAEAYRRIVIDIGHSPAHPAERAILEASEIDLSSTNRG